VMEVGSGKSLDEAIDRASDSVTTCVPTIDAFSIVGGLPENRLRECRPPAECLYNGRTYLHTLVARARAMATPVVFSAPGVDAADSMCRRPGDLPSSWRPIPP